jgi:hypothetical protein
MRALVVYESLFGSTRELAEAIAAGLGTRLQVRLSHADDVRNSDAAVTDLLVAGGPTHGHSLSTPASRQEAASRAKDPDTGLHLDQAQPGIGLREWFDELGAAPALFAAFDTRTDIPRLLAGAASVRIGRELRRRGSTPVVPPESFLVTRYAGLKAGEAARGRVWGEQVAAAALRARPNTSTEHAS